MIGELKEEMAPDLMKPIIGFRSWEIRDGKLSAPYTAHYWSTETNQASCRGRNGFRYPARRIDLHSGKPAPQAECSCGLYAYHQPQGFTDSSLYNEVHGAIQAWGRIELHQTGFRAEFAKPIALALPPRPRMKWFHRSLYWAAFVSVLAIFSENLILQLSCGLYLMTFLGAYLPLYLEPPVLKGWWQLRENTKKAAKALGLPLVPYTKLEAYTKTYGSTALDIYPELESPNPVNMDDNFLA